MNQDYWIKQVATPAFQALLWSRPEMKSTAGKLLIIGGNVHSFTAPAEAYAAAAQAGIGTTRVLLPASLTRTVGKLFPEAEFVPSNPSGGFAMSSLTELVTASQWANGCLLAGDFGRNSETISMLENYASHYSGLLAITQDTVDFFSRQPQSIIGRTATLLVISIEQLQRLGQSLQLSYAFTSSLNLMQFVELLHTFTLAHPNIYLLCRHANSYLVAVDGKVSTTPATATSNWQGTVAAAAITWWLQNPQKPFDALTTSLVAQLSAKK